MRVIDLLGSDFDQACLRLADHLSARGCEGLVGIRSGGFYVARRMQELGLEVPLYAVACRRASTSTKEQVGLRRLAYHMPKGLRDFLRVMEHRWRERRFEQGQLEPRTVQMEPALLERLQQRPEPALWLVDDAVDSGSTLQAVSEAIRAVRPGLVLHTAAITQTFKEPLIEPDFVLYKSVLVRFPWSMDSPS